MIPLKERFKRKYNSCWKAILRWQWSRAGMDAPIVLMVHGFVPTVEDCDSAFKLTALSFERCLTHMLEEGWRAMTYDEVRSRAMRLEIKGDRLEEDRKCFYVTFDDVYDTVYTEALPILERLHIPFTIFVSKNLVGRVGHDGRPWITKAHLDELVKSPLCMVGCHGVDHVQFKIYSELEMRNVCAENKQWLIDEYRIFSDSFAFPYGRWQDLNKWNIQYLSAYGFSVGFSAIEGTLLSAHTTGKHFLPRVNMSETFVEKFVNYQPLKWKDCEGR